MAEKVEERRVKIDGEMVRESDSFDRDEGEKRPSRLE